MKHWLTLAIALAPALCAAESIRCGDRIIDRGTSSAEVSDLCGKPAQIDHSTMYGGIATAVGGRSVVGSGSQIEVEIWTYNFGPDQLMARIRFEDGIVADIKSLGYGYNEP